jgi:hypothetical protein
MNKFADIKCRRDEAARTAKEKGWMMSNSPSWADIDYLLSCIEGRGVEDARKLTQPEINHLLSLLEAERESGEYAGPREQYYARTERLIKWCQEQVK